MNNLNFIPIKSKSGNIVESAYDEATQKAVVKFKGGSSYEYEMKPEMWKEFSATFDSDENSTGTYFHQKVRNLPFKKL